MFLTQCAKKSIPASSASPAEEVSEMKKKYNATQIAESKIIFEKHCGECHSLHNPEEFTVKQWDKILPKMSRKSKLTEEQAGLLRAWVITNARV